MINYMKEHAVRIYSIWFKWLYYNKYLTWLKLVSSNHLSTFQDGNYSQKEQPYHSAPYKKQEPPYHSAPYGSSGRVAFSIPSAKPKNGNNENDVKIV